VWWSGLLSMDGGKKFGTPMELQPFIVGTPQETPEDQYQDKERTFLYLLSFV
jgi:hypothetical protein